MSNIVITGGAGVLLTTTVTIAEGAGRDHKAVIKLVRDNRAALERFGRIELEVLPFETKGGTQRREVAYLNEQQATLLMTFMRNTGVALDFKIRLVEEFYRMRQQLQGEPQPQATADDSVLLSRVAAFAAPRMAIAKALGLDDNMAMLCVTQEGEKRFGVNMLQELGATHLLTPGNVQYLTPTELGREHDMSAIAVNRALRDLGYQMQRPDAKGRNVWHLTDTGRAAGARLMDTGKKHGDGTAVQQIKWPAEVARLLVEEAAA